VVVLAIYDQSANGGGYYLSNSRMGEDYDAKHNPTWGVHGWYGFYRAGNFRAALGVSTCARPKFSW
jgi:hypothetical protein